MIASLVKNILLFSSLYLLFSCNLTFGQQLIRSSIGCLGSTYTENGVIIRQTVGQSSNTAVFSNGSVRLNQGFQQPLYSIFANEVNEPIDFDIYPNPSNGQSLLKINSKLDSYTVKIHDAQGKILIIMPEQSLPATWLQMQEYKPGSYFITVTSRERIGSKSLILLQH